MRDSARQIVAPRRPRQHIEFENIGKLAEQKRAARHRTPDLDRRCDMHRLEADDELECLEHIRAKHVGAMRGEIYPEWPRRAHRRGQRRSTALLEHAKRLDLDRKGSEPVAQKCSRKWATGAIRCADESDLRCAPWIVGRMDTEHRM